VRYSVGVVGMKEHVEEIEALRRELSPEIYVWVNAYKRVEDYYSEDELRRLEAVDALFPINNVRHASAGRACRAGESVISVDGDGTIRRCHFIKEPIGSIYERGWEEALRPRVCTNATCGCHIGYVHMPHLQLYEVFGDGILERIPVHVSINGRYSSGSSKPAIQATA
jgi:MoaA/NifB/PqqE/SkfB family radical SAM enzyme